MQVVTQWRASEQLCSSTIVTTDATNNIQVSTRPPAPITRQPPHLDENIWNQNLLDRLLEYIRLPREMFWKASFELLTALLLVAATRHFVSADCLWEEKVSVFKGSSTTTKNLQYLWWNLKTPYRASKAQIKHQIQGLMVATGEITGFDLAKKKVEICTKKGQNNDDDELHFLSNSLTFVQQQESWNSARRREWRNPWKLPATVSSVEDQGKPKKVECEENGILGGLLL